MDKKHSTLIENYTWHHHGIRFVTIHIVGSLNGRSGLKNRSKKQRSALSEEIAQREVAAIDWLNDAFQRAKQEQAKAVFIAIHANPNLDLKHEDAKHHRMAFGFFRQALDTQLKNFDKPVVLAHGDSHYFRIDSPSLDDAYSGRKHFTRVESFGDNNAAWIKVTVDTESDSIFSYQAHPGEP